MILTRSQARRRNSGVSKTFELPMDIIFDILSRLPAKSLLRFKSVSKTWYNLIKSPNFIKQHLRGSKQNPSLAFSAVLSTVLVRETGKRIFRINLIDALDKPIDLDLPFLSDQINLSVLSICDGLVCVILYNESTRLSRIAICNPLTGEFRMVPGMVEGCIYYEVTIIDTFEMYAGFGLNGDNGYEFFKIVYEFRNGEPVLEGEAYSLTNDSWRKINIKKGDHSKPRECYQARPVFVHGVFYWSDTDYNVKSVVSFDVENDVFEEFLAPDGCSDEIWMLLDLKEEVAVVIYHDDNVRSFDIWVLNEKEKSWELKLKLNMKEGNDIKEFRVDIVLGRAGSNELVVVDYDYKNSELLLYKYNMCTDDVEDLPYVNVDKPHGVFLYTESLVSVNTSDDVVEFGLDWPEKRRGNILRM